MIPHADEECPCCRIKRRAIKKQKERDALLEKRREKGQCEECGSSSFDLDLGGWHCRMCDTYK
jgi:ribosomal protein L37AE/L43A